MENKKNQYESTKKPLTIRDKLNVDNESEMNDRIGAIRSNLLQNRSRSNTFPTDTNSLNRINTIPGSFPGYPTYADFLPKQDNITRVNTRDRSNTFSNDSIIRLNSGYMGSVTNYNTFVNNTNINTMHRNSTNMAMGNPYMQQSFNPYANNFNQTNSINMNSNIGNTTGNNTQNNLTGSNLSSNNTTNMESRLKLTNSLTLKAKETIAKYREYKNNIGGRGGYRGNDRGGRGGGMGV